MSDDKRERDAVDAKSTENESDADNHAGSGGVSPGSVSPGSVSPGSVSPGSVSPGSVSPGSVSPGSVSPGSDSDEPGPDSLGDGRLQSLMKRALSSEDAEAEVDVLAGVQRKLRDRSGGKFYRDGWSTARHPPFATYFITSLMMLAVIAIIYAILTPLVGDPIAAPPEPKPIQIIPPR